MAKKIIAMNSQRHELFSIEGWVIFCVDNEHRDVHRGGIL
jgi:hypothetical protein